MQADIEDIRMTIPKNSLAGDIQEEIDEIASNIDEYTYELVVEHE